MHNSWDKNDPKDALVILHLLKAGLSQNWHEPPPSSTNDAQKLRRTHQPLTRNRMWHSTHYYYFPLYFPEIEHSDHRLAHPVAAAVFTPWRDHYPYHMRTSSRRTEV